MLKIYKYIKNNFFLSECSNYNSESARKLSRTKEKGKKIFIKNHIPTAESAVFINPIKAIKFVRKHGFPIVVKPNFGGFSRGSFFPIKNYLELLVSSFLVKLFWPKTIIERYLEGKNYRVVVSKGKIIAITRRYNAFIKGDGEQTISKLIDEENGIRKKMKLFPVMSKIIKDKKLIKYIKKRSKKLKNIPKKDEIVNLNRKITLSTGGIVENLPLNSISLKNKLLFEKILKIFNSSLLGIDVIFEKGIEVDYDKQKCIVLEVNSRPYIKMHKYPRYGKPIDIKKIREEK